MMKSPNACLAALAAWFLLVISITVGASQINSSSRTDELQYSVNATHDTTLNLRGLVVTSITQQELDHCVGSMEVVATNGEVGQDEFIRFLEGFSGRALAFETFDDLPLSLILIFYTAACSAGRSCGNDDAKIVLDHVGASIGLLTVFCTSVKDVAVVQIDYRFQYQIRYEVGESATDTLLEEGGDNEIKTNLEDATQMVLLEHFGCDLGSQRRTSESLVIDALKRNENEESHHFHEWSSLDKTISRRNRRTGRRRAQEAKRRTQRIGLPDCDFRVHAEISNVFHIGCFPSSEDDGEDTRCALVSSNVVVTAASIYQEESQSELRAIVADILKTAFMNNELTPFLE